MLTTKDKYTILKSIRDNRIKSFIKCMQMFCGYASLESNNNFPLFFFFFFYISSPFIFCFVGTFIFLLFLFFIFRERCMFIFLYWWVIDQSGKYSHIFFSFFQTHIWFNLRQSDTWLAVAKVIAYQVNEWNIPLIFKQN